MMLADQCLTPAVLGRGEGAGGEKSQICHHQGTLSLPLLPLAASRGWVGTG